MDKLRVPNSGPLKMNTLCRRTDASTYVDDLHDAGYTRQRLSLRNRMSEKRKEA